MKLRKLRKLIPIASLLTAINISAQESIDYSWVELNYEDQKVSTYGFGEALTIDGSFEISDSFYLRADYSRMRPDYSLIYENSYSMRLGFHKGLSEKSDFYAELGYRNYEPRFFKSNGAIEAVIGTRSILSPKFELITALAYKTHDGIDNNINTPSATDDGLNFGVTSLYKINDSSSLHFGVKFEGALTSPLFGYRYNW